MAASLAWEAIMVIINTVESGALRTCVACSLLQGTVLCMVGCLAASLASSRQMPVTAPSLPAVEAQLLRGKEP